ncbi:MAG TPA: hypothetical protein VMI75_11175 [Polyangiaceae bacterium]|nr:hypothetical protein [Polyangiaceae bacterium]
MSARSLGVGAVVGVALLAGAPAARGQGSTAQTQFDYGLAEMEAGRFASGCPALAESYRIDPHPGVLFTLAECENKWGKIASAFTHYEAYIDLFAHMSDEQKAHQRGRDRIAAAQRDALRPLLPQLAIALPAGAPAGTAVTRDGDPLGAPSLGVALPVDPGEHVIVAKTPDGVRHETRVTLERGQRRNVVLDLSATPIPTPTTTTTATPTATPTPNPVRTWAWIAGGIGLAGIAVGSIAGAVVMSDASTIHSQCQSDQSCTSSGLSAASQSRTFGVISDVGFAVGGAGLVTSLVLFLLPGPKPVVPVASAQPHGGFVGLRATW